MEELVIDAPPVVPGPISPADVAARIVGRTDGIGPSPSLFRLEERLRHGDTSAQQLGRLIEGSPALAARVLRIANSAFYAPAEPVVSLGRAVAMLGDTMLRQVVLATLISTRRSTTRTPRQMLAAARLMGDAVRSAVVCRALAGATRLALPDEAFVAGLLHDLGHIYLLDDDDDRYAGYLLEASNFADGLERELAFTGTTHTLIGVAFADSWRLPPAVRAVLEGHHDPHPGTLAAMVRASDWLVRELNATNFQDPEIFAERVEFALAAIGLDQVAWEAMVPRVRDEYAELLTVFELDFE
jgi:HD-like signal output (HDOD) protein